MKTIRLWLATIATLLCSLSASAHDFEVGGIYYYITSSTDLTVAVTFRGASVKEYPEEYSGIITIPSTVIYGENTYSVTKIASSAFKYCSTLTAITLPESMTSIGADAFSGCSGLNSISIPGNVISIGNDAFINCTKVRLLS